MRAVCTHFIRLVFGTLYKVGVVDRCIDESRCAGALLARVLFASSLPLSAYSHGETKKNVVVGC